MKKGKYNDVMTMKVQRIKQESAFFENYVNQEIFWYNILHVREKKIGFT